MAMIEKSIEGEVPVSTAYNQWTQFEEFPQFMEGVEEVTQLDDQRLHWVATVGGQKKEWYARITEQIPTSVSPGPARAAVHFGRRDVPPPGREPDARDAPDGVRAGSIVEEVGDKLGSSTGASRATSSGSRNSSSRVASRPAPGEAQSRDRCRKRTTQAVIRKAAAPKGRGLRLCAYGPPGADDISERLREFGTVADGGKRHLHFFAVALADGEAYLRLARVVADGVDEGAQTFVVAVFVIGLFEDDAECGSVV